MITKAGTVGIYVSDQDRALDFYVNALDFEKRIDEPMSAEARWIEVAPAGAETAWYCSRRPVSKTASEPGRTWSWSATTSKLLTRNCEAVAWSSPRSLPNSRGECGRSSKTWMATSSGLSKRKRLPPETRTADDQHP